MAAEDAEGRKKLAGYMLRAPMSLEKMTYDASSGTVIYRSKMHLGLKRNFQVMSGAAWLERSMSSHPGLVRTSRALRGVVLEPRRGRAGKESFHAIRRSAAGPERGAGD